MGGKGPAGPDQPARVRPRLIRALCPVAGKAGTAWACPALDRKIHRARTVMDTGRHRARERRGVGGPGQAWTAGLTDPRQVTTLPGPVNGTGGVIVTRMGKWCDRTHVQHEE